MCIWPLGREDPLEEGNGTHSSILAWGIRMGRGAWWVIVHMLQTVGHDWRDLVIHTRMICSWLVLRPVLFATLTLWLTVLAVLIFLLFLSMPGTLPPQGLCSCCSITWSMFYSRYSWCLLSSFLSLLKYLFGKAFLVHSKRESFPL